MQRSGQDIPKVPTLTNLLRLRAERSPGAELYIFLEDSRDDVGHAMTVGELDTRARAIAVALQELARPGERALLLYPPGLDYIAAFFGCAYAGVIAVPAYPPDPARLGRTLPRLISIIESSEASLVLTTSAILSFSSMATAAAAQLAKLTWFATDRVESSEAESWRAPEQSAESVAFLQFTSGSTSRPRGVVLTHGALLNNLEQIRCCMRMTPSDRMVGWLPPYHDMGLIGGILAPLYAGMQDVLMSPAHFLKRPIQWLRAISKYRATISGGPNFAFELCARKISLGEEHLDLSSWRVAPVGAEVVQHASLMAFSRKFSEIGFRTTTFYPCYGLAECTLIATGGTVERGPVVAHLDARSLEAGRAVSVTEGAQGSRTIVASGRGTGTTRVVIVDPKSSRRLADGEVGEIWLRSESRGNGYWGLPAESERVFRAHLAGDDTISYLRTGDLGFIHGDELFVTGRSKDLIILRGRNLCPEDLERVATSAHPSIRPGCAAAFAIDAEGHEDLALALEVEKGTTQVDEVVAAVRKAIRESFDLMPREVLLLCAGTLPKTSSGKIQRSACSAGFQSKTLEVVR